MDRSINHPFSYLNYNRIIYDVIKTHWLAHTGSDMHPLGDDKETADVHALPVHVKILLLHAMVHWRLQRPDVENAIKVRLFGY